MLAHVNLKDKTEDFSPRKFMDTSITEVNYPLNFRETDAKALGEHLRLRHSVELVGMKRVGISNFLRFFLNHEKVVSVYINHGEKHLFIPVDLNDLVEIEVFPFWILTFKRLVDKVAGSEINEETKKEISALFLDAIQSRDLFLTVDALRRALLLIAQEGYLPTLFLLRFDRIGEVINGEFFANLVGLRDATDQKLSYVFTSFRTLDQIAPKVFERRLLSVFSHPLYIKPAEKEDFKTIFQALVKKYKLVVDGQIEARIWELCGGHVQYLQLAAIVLSHKEGVAEKKLREVLGSDERIKYLAEEIWEGLDEKERNVLLRVLKNKKVSSLEKEEEKYLWETGMVRENHESHIFGLLFEDYLEKSAGEHSGVDEKIEFTKKEQLLYNYLFGNKNEVCEREKIIEAVWSEVEDLGVSDWTIDRLIARLRTKMKKQGSSEQIVTVKTRGYKLT